MQYQLLGKYTVYSRIKGIACIRKCACNKKGNDQAQLRNYQRRNQTIKLRKTASRQKNKQEKTLNTLLHIINTLSMDKATVCFFTVSRPNFFQNQ